MDSSSKPDIPKIVLAGIPILLILWGMCFVLLAFVTRDAVISKYGSLMFFLFSIPIYGYLSYKYASKLNATINAEESRIRKNNIFQKGSKRYKRYVTIDIPI